MKAHTASIKLAGLYLAVMMAISLFFSINLYRLSVQEFNRDLRGQRVFINQTPAIGPATFGGKFGTQFLQDREQAYSQAKDRILEQIIFTNLVILVGGGFLCYYLARRTLAPIEEAHEVQNRFTADASHELRTPIATMQTEIEVAMMDPHLTLDRAKGILKSNLEELARLTSLSQGLLRLSQLEKNGLEKQVVNLPSIMLDAIDRVKQEAEKKRILIEHKLVKDIKVNADGSSLTEAFTIILDNAIKYSPEKTKITVTVNKDHGYAVAAIKDEGMGIDESQLPYIFDRFYRADAARTKKGANGYGLGLAIAKNIIDLSHGNISVSSKAGRGSTFVVRLLLKN